MFTILRPTCILGTMSIDIPTYFVIFLRPTQGQCSLSVAGNVRYNELNPYLRSVTQNRTKLTNFYAVYCLNENSELSNSIVGGQQLSPYLRAQQAYIYWWILKTAYAHQSVVLFWNAFLALPLTTWRPLSRICITLALKLLFYPNFAIVSISCFLLAPKYKLLLFIKMVQLTRAKEQHTF